MAVYRVLPDKVDELLNLYSPTLDKDIYRDFTCDYTDELIKIPSLEIQKSFEKFDKNLLIFKPNSIDSGKFGNSTSIENFKSNTQFDCDFNGTNCWLKYFNYSTLTFQYTNSSNDQSLDYGLKYFDDEFYNFNEDIEFDISSNPGIWCIYQKFINFNQDITNQSEKILQIPIPIFIRFNKINEFIQMIKLKLYPLIPISILMIPLIYLSNFIIPNSTPIKELMIVATLIILKNLLELSIIYLSSFRYEIFFHQFLQIENKDRFNYFWFIISIIILTISIISIIIFSEIKLFKLRFINRFQQSQFKLLYKDRNNDNNYRYLKWIVIIGCKILILIIFQIFKIWSLLKNYKEFKINPIYLILDSNNEFISYYQLIPFEFMVEFSFQIIIVIVSIKSIIFDDYQRGGHRHNNNNNNNINNENLVENEVDDHYLRNSTIFEIVDKLFITILELIITCTSGILIPAVVKFHYPLNKLDNYHRYEIIIGIWFYSSNYIIPTILLFNLTIFQIIWFLQDSKDEKIYDLKKNPRIP
ncbi:hypothetical protein WICMUC_000783 [Wickerhamomyces mucosus]|uniref:Uncharacterized protein n=1 Tax=Wickerhamomyces mucosus TaxID=1378264 RepID=A0A9P8TIJ9_9ASCO|nr:hypothetical protein WICMUC_000783 [Wickerhamomyces mucosus]